MGSGFAMVTVPSNATAASLKVLVDDGLLSSAEVEQSIQVVQEQWVGLEILRRDPLLKVGGTGQIVVIGKTADGTRKSIPASAIQYSSTDSNIVQVTDRGLLIGQRIGTAGVVVQAFGLTAATAVSVGTVDSRRLDFFPDAYALEVGQTRKLMVQEQLSDRVVDIGLASQGARYIVADPSLLSVNANGQLTALRAGKTEVTIVHGGISQVVPIVVSNPTTGIVEIDADGGLVSNGQIVVGIPPGSFDAPISLSVQTLGPESLPYNLPTTWNFGGGLLINYGDELPSFH